MASTMRLGCFMILCLLILIIVVAAQATTVAPTIPSTTTIDCDPTHPWNCDNSTKCIPKVLLCDGSEQCSDGSDEDYDMCLNYTCQSDEFKCYSHLNNSRRVCINNTLRCDGIAQCLGGEDEAGCPTTHDTTTPTMNYTCQSDEFKCYSHLNNSRRVCINNTLRCDGLAQCLGGEDEAGCWTTHDTTTPTTRTTVPVFNFPTTPRRTITCRSNYWRCKNGKCIVASFRCDGDNDCGDRSDEERPMCKNITCSPREFKCLSNVGTTRKVCVRRTSVCNGRRDCQAGEDEEGCTTTPAPRTCKPTEYKCRDGSCIPRRLRCDSYSDCLPAGEDERVCSKVTCLRHEFRCHSGQCIESSKECNGIVDCRDYSDEDTTRCSKVYANCKKDEFDCRNHKCIPLEYVCNNKNDCGGNGNDYDEKFCDKANECAESFNDCQQKCVDLDYGFRCECHEGYVPINSTHCREVKYCAERPGICSQFCENLAGSDSCDCETGYELDSTDNGTCSRKTDVSVCASDDLNTMPCRNLPGSYRCGCGEGYELNADDNTTCIRQDDIEPVLLFANKIYIRRMATNGTQLDNYEDRNVFAHAFDYDYRDKLLFLVDMSKWIVKRMDDEENVTIILKTHLRGTEGIAVDWVAKKLYFTNAILEGITVCEYNGTHMKSLIKKAVKKLRGIALHPGQGYMYWTNWDIHSPSISRMGMDGSEITPIHTTGLEWPNGITIDYTTNQMWWADARLDRIEFSNLDGSNRHIVARKVTHPFAITVFDDYIYWTDSQLRVIQKANRYTGQDNTTLHGVLRLQPFDIHIYHPLRQPFFPNPCEDNNGGCSHLCLIAPGGKNITCACPDNFVLLSDGKTCQSNCNDAQFLCERSDHRCIPKLWVCDGEDDCKNGTDEFGCPTNRTCSPGLFQCKIVRGCATSSRLCNGRNDCRDASDESPELCANRTCLPHEYRCGETHQCISGTGRCNNRRECADGTDEQNCTTTAVCKSNEFQCNNSKCIPILFYCDVDDDCGDNSDENVTECLLYRQRVPCREGWVKCKGNYRCILQSQECDRINHCRDNSDERNNCPRRCTSSQFRCDNGRCIPKSWKCDLDDDCRDGSDEKVGLCPYRNCSSNQFRCDNGRCIHKSGRCNTLNNCRDNSDEKNCQNHTCPARQLKCRSGHCYPSRYRCDGRPRCPDLSDESNCNNTCPRSYPFKCRNGLCVRLTWLCDGDDDCRDNSDEARDVCQNITCSSYKYRCPHSMQCLSRRKLCDKKVHCSDKSDENNFTICGHREACKGLQFTCGNRRCISKSKLCDRVNDCGDNTDEHGCHIGRGLRCGYRRTHNCSYSCRTVSNGYMCVCRSGFKPAEKNPKICVDLNECETWGNHCPHKCININGSFLCECADGFIEMSPNSTILRGPRKSNGTICKAAGDAIILVAEDSNILAYQPGGDLRVVVTNQTNIRALAVDTSADSQFVFWTDTSPGNAKIRRWRVDSLINKSCVAPDELGIPNLEQPEGIAFDWIGRNIYWTDMGKNHIRMATSTGKFSKTLICGREFKPSSIVVSPEIGKMFWVNSNVDKAAIESAWMNGRHRATLISRNMHHRVVLAMDYYKENRLYWTNPGSGSIESAKPDGSDRVVVIEDAKTAFTLDVFGADMYWFSERSNSLNKQDKFGRGVNVTVFAVRNQPRAVQFFIKQRYPSTYENSTCHSLMCNALCLPVPYGGAECACPDGSKLKDGSSTECDLENITPTLLKLGQTVHTCSNGGTCYIGSDNYTTCKCPKGYEGSTCDRVTSTTLSTTAESDTSVAISTTTEAPSVSPSTPNLRNCSSGFWKCNDSKCIRDFLRCDGDKDCPDGSDEDPFPCITYVCPSYKFKCISHAGRAGKPVCIWRTALCDGDNDCIGGEDEQGCPTTPTPTGCTADQFKCKDNTCIDKSRVCDTVADCEKMEDETMPNCTTVACTIDQFKCNSGQCINRSQECDGVEDCQDYSDEYEYLCTREYRSCGDLFDCHNGKCIHFLKACDGINDCASTGQSRDELVCAIRNECTLNVHDCDLSTTTCHDEALGFSCRCKDGYSHINSTHCRPIDICIDRPDTCSQICKKTTNGYQCACGDYYKLNKDNSTCQREKKDPEPILIFANKDFIRQMGTDGKNVSKFETEHEYTHVFDYDYRDDSVFLVDASSKKIKRIDQKTNVTVISSSNVAGTEGIAVDWITRKLYVTNNKLKGLYVCEYNGTHMKILLKNKSPLPRAIALHPGKGYLYWTDWNLAAFIARMGMDGSNMTKLITTGLFWPNGLTIDYITDKMWWVDAHLDRIEFCNLDGTNRRVVLQDAPHPYAITIFEDFIYWTEWNLKIIEKANRYTGKNRSRLTEQPLSHKPFDIHIYHPLRQPAFPNPCGSDNGGCSHLCLITPGENGKNNMTCACPEHFVLSSDGKTCEENCNDAQFACGRSDHKCIPKLWVCDGQKDCKGGEDEDQNCPGTRHCKPGLFQCKNSNRRQCIYSFQLCDGRSNCRDRSDEASDLCTNRTCLPTEFKCGTGQCIHESWKCDKQKDCQNGEDEKNCNRTCEEEEFRCDNGKCIPKLWFCDWDDDCGDQSDDNRTYCWWLRKREPCREGWVQCKSTYRCIRSTGLCDGDNDCRDNSDESKEHCICDRGEFQCKNKRCIPKRWKCDFIKHCSDNSDEDLDMCLTEYPKCTESEFRCKNHKCISTASRCNLVDDCGDNSDEDEDECRDFVCGNGKFKCASGHCINLANKCDTHKHCWDASDEIDCEPQHNGSFCLPGLHECNTHVCINRTWICDGDDDCGDFSDETEPLCRNFPCDTSRKFQCKNIKQCISKSRVCDKKRDCRDGSDEIDLSLCGHREKCNGTSSICANHRCISIEKLCDGVNDCGDHSDEHGCVKAANQTCGNITATCQGTCRNLTQNRGYICTCKLGYKPNQSNGRVCEDVNECASWGNNCPQKCKNTKGSYSCHCSDDFVAVAVRAPRGPANPNGTQCMPKSSHDETILISMGSSVGSYIPKYDRYSEMVIHQTNIRGMTVDTTGSGQMVYWTDIAQHSISRAKVMAEVGAIATPQTLDIDNLRTPESIAFDWIGGNLYWIDSTQKHIRVARTDGNFPKTLISDNNFQPTSFVVSSSIGKMFWVDAYETKPRIESAWMDGRNRVAIIGVNLHHSISLAVDHYQDSKLYWTNPDSRIIESAKPDGSDRVVVARGVTDAYSLDVFGSDMYWISHKMNYLFRMDKFGRGVNDTVTDVRGIGRSSTVRYYVSSRYPSENSNICKDKQCGALCLPTPEGPICVCPDGSYMRAGSTSACEHLKLKFVPQPPTPCYCINNGTCVFDKDKQHYRCRCFNGYTGEQCKIPPSPTTSTITSTPTTTKSTPPAAIESTRATTRKQTTDKPIISESVKHDGKETAAIVVPVLLAIIIIVVLVIVVLFMWKTGRIGKRADDQIRLEEEEVVPQEYADTSFSMEPHDSHPGFTNPMYDTLHLNDQENMAEVDTIKHPGETIDGQASTLPKKNGFQ